MSTRDFTFSGLLTAAADAPAETSSSDCIWSEAICNNNSFSRSNIQSSLTRLQALQKLSAASEPSASTTTSDVTLTNTTGNPYELQFVSRLPLNSSLSLHASSILGFDSDATNSSASSSCTLNTSSNSLHGSSSLLERDNNNTTSQILAPNSTTTRQYQQQKSKHLLELQREIKEEADEIFADINSLINNRSSLYSNLEDFDLDGANNDVRGSPLHPVVSLASARQQSQQNQSLQNNRAVTQLPKIIATLSTEKTTPTTVAATTSISSLLSNHLNAANHHHSSSSSSISSNNQRLQNVTHFHSPTTTRTSSNTPSTTAGTPNLQSDDTLFTTDGDQDFFEDFNQTTAIGNETSGLLHSDSCGQYGVKSASSEQAPSSRTLFAENRLVSSSSIVKVRPQPASMLDCMQQEDSIHEDYRLLSSYDKVRNDCDDDDDDDDDDDNGREDNHNHTSANSYLCLADGRSSDTFSQQQDDDMMRQHEQIGDDDDDDDDEVNNIRYSDEHGFNPCNRFTGQQQQTDVQKVIQQVTNNLPKPCVFFLEGNCRRSDCKYSHDLSSITCKYWIEGFCFKGEMCPFSHSYTPLDSQNMLDGEEEGLESSLTKRELNPTFVIESEADFPSLPLDAPNAPLSDNTQGNIKANALSKNLKNRILSSNPAVVFKTVKKKRRKG